MYDPKGNGKDKAVHAVEFIEREPPKHLRGIVHRYLELKTTGALAENYRFHALPDACTYVVFDLLNQNIAGVSKLRAQSEEFDLGKNFHFINVRFLPGVWKSENEPIGHGQLDTPYTGNLPLVEINGALIREGFAKGQSLLTKLVERLLVEGMLAPNPITVKIFENLDSILSVKDMAQVTDLSTRQLQRILKRTTGFAPHDFLKVLRLQQSLKGDAAWSYADQSHFIHSFRNATGYTPGKYARKFDV